MMRTHSLTRTLPKPVFLKAASSGPCVATQHKHAALLNRLFVPQRQSSAPDEGAAVGATQTAAAAPAGEYDRSPSPVAPAAAAAGMEVQDEQAEIEDADTFLRHSVVPWLKAMQEDASDRNISLPAVLKMRMLASVTSNGQPLASSLAELVLSRFRALVHWKGYVNFQQVPKSSKKRHIAHLHAIIRRICLCSSWHVRQ